METQILAALVGAVAGLLGGMITAWVGIRNKAVDRVIERNKLWAAGYEKTLLDQRLVDYKRLWGITQPTSTRLIAFMTAESARELSEALTNWYYQTGGILLSADARNAFFLARQSLDAFNQARASSASRAFSELRSALCTDLNSRAGPSMGHPQLAKSDQPPLGASQDNFRP